MIMVGTVVLAGGELIFQKGRMGGEDDTQLAEERTYILTIYEILLQPFNIPSVPLTPPC